MLKSYFIAYLWKKKKKQQTVFTCGDQRKHQGGQAWKWQCYRYIMRKYIYSYNFIKQVPLRKIKEVAILIHQLICTFFSTNWSKFLERGLQSGYLRKNKKKATDMLSELLSYVLILKAINTKLLSSKGFMRNVWILTSYMIINLH